METNKTDSSHLMDVRISFDVDGRKAFIAGAGWSAGTVVGASAAILTVNGIVGWWRERNSFTNKARRKLGL